MVYILFWVNIVIPDILLVKIGIFFLLHARIRFLIIFLRASVILAFIGRQAEVLSVDAGKGMKFVEFPQSKDGE